LGRDRSKIKVTKLLMIVVAPTLEEANADLAEIAKLKAWNDGIMEMVRKALIFGDPDEVGERIAEAMGHGIDGVTVDLPVNGHNTERI
jgi:alkanesulfonate monooxygenase SsuD/methylene tetrahydromethanopterin reductase-like flavin-dependent oxidoreductase (luciferase family)